MKKNIIFLFTLVTIGAKAQLARTFHQSFDMGEIKKVAMMLRDSLEVQPWAGNTVMTETTVEMENAEPAFLDGLIKEGRYQLKAEKKGDGMIINPLYTKKNKIKTKTGIEIFEKVRVRIYVPEVAQVVNIDGIVISPIDAVADLSKKEMSQMVQDSTAMKPLPTNEPTKKGKKSKSKKGSTKATGTKSKSKSKSKKKKS